MDFSPLSGFLLSHLLPSTSGGDSLLYFPPFSISFSSRLQDVSLSLFLSPSADTPLRSISVGSWKRSRGS